MNPHLFSELCDYLDLADLLKIVRSSNYVFCGVFDKLQAKRHGEMWLHLEQLTAKIQYDSWNVNKTTKKVPALPNARFITTMSLAVTRDSRCLPQFMREIDVFGNLHTLYLYDIRNFSDLRLFSRLHTIYIEFGYEITSLDGLQNLYEVHIRNLRITSVEPLKRVHTVEISLCAAITDIELLRDVHTLILDFPAIERSYERRFEKKQPRGVDLSALTGVTHLILGKICILTSKFPVIKGYTYLLRFDHEIENDATKRFKVLNLSNKDSFRSLGRWNLIYYPVNKDENYEKTSRIHYCGVDKFGHEDYEDDGFRSCFGDY